MEIEENLLTKVRQRDSLNITFGKFKNDIDHITDDTKNIIIDVEELEEDFKHCYKRCC